MRLRGKTGKTYETMSTYLTMETKAWLGREAKRQGKKLYQMLEGIISEHRSNTRKRTGNRRGAPKI